MNYPVGKLLTREYDDIERRILQARLIRRTDSWENTIRFVCVDGKFGFKDVNQMEEFEIADLIRYIRYAPLFDCLPYSLRVKAYHWAYVSPSTIINFYDLMERYKWLYDTETWESEK
jgi:hypothetical protein